MVNLTGYLVLHSHTVASSILLSKILTTALQKIEKTLYVQVTHLQFQASSAVSYNRIVDQIYFVSSKKAPRIDTRVILKDFRDCLLGNIVDSTAVTTSKSVDVSMSDCKLKCSASDGSLILESADGVVGNEETEEISKRTSDNVINQAQEEKMYENVVLGGTFDRLHSGHKMLLSSAILRCSKRLTICVTDGPMIKTKKLFELIEPCEIRISKLREFLNDIEPRLQYNIVPITDPYGPTAEDPNLQVNTINLILIFFNVQNLNCLFLFEDDSS